MAVGLGLVPEIKDLAGDTDNFGVAEKESGSQHIEPLMRFT